MARVKLTKRVIDAAVPQSKDVVIWDSEVAGLGLKVTPSGRKSFVLFYRTASGEQRKPKVGDYGAITLDQARGIARDMLGTVRAGGDPSAARQDARAAPTVADAVQRFLDEHASLKKPLTRASYESQLRLHVLPSWGSKKVAAIDHGDVARLVARIGKERPVLANRTRAVLSKMFALCEKWRWRPTGSNPCVHVEKYRETPKHRDLSADELVRLANALSAAEPDSPRAVAALRVLLFTGCRRNEVLHLRWEEVDLERGLLRLGDSKTGAKVVRLNQAAVDVIAAQSRVPGSAYVFPSDRADGKPLADAKRAWERVRKAAGLEGLRLHDLRHHYATTAAGRGASLLVIGALLGHRNPSTTQRYAVLADDPARRAAEEVGRVLLEQMRARMEQPS